MTYYTEDPCNYSEYDEIFNDWYEIEGVRKIQELSRQLRTFFNYKTKVLRYRYRSSPKLIESMSNTKYLSHKQKIEALTYSFITILKNLKKPNQTLEQGIHFLFFDNEKRTLNTLSEITEKLSNLLHFFSEENIHNYPKFLKFNIVLAQNICLVKKCLHTQFSGFFEELEINYFNLEREMIVLLEKKSAKKEQLKKQLEEKLTI